MKMTGAFIVLAFALAACSGGESPTAAEAEPPQEESALAEPMTEAVEKAEAVEDQLAEHKEAIDDALEDAEEEAEEATGE